MLQSIRKHRNTFRRNGKHGQCIRVSACEHGTLATKVNVSDDQGICSSAVATTAHLDVAGR